MKIKLLSTLLLLMGIAFSAGAQTHISTGKYACRLVPKSMGYEKYTCPVCAKLDEQKKRDKIDEDYRPSLFSKGGLNSDAQDPYHFSSHFEKQTFLELAKMIKKEKVLQKTNVKLKS